jgi:hypothetical protein
MIAVHKFEWPKGYVSKFQVSMPHGAEILCAQTQRNLLCIWAKVNTDNSFEQREFTLCGTGHLAPDGKYIGTVQLHDGDLVLHIMETTKSQ